MSTHHSLRRPHHRLGLSVSATLLAVGTLAACGEQETTAESPGKKYDEASAAAAADWLVSELDSGLLSYRTEYGPYVDHGLSIDAALSLDEIGGHDEAVQQISDAVADGVESYISGEAFGDPGSTYAGPVAKTVVLAQVAGADPTGFGGVDLVDRLEAVTSDRPATAGRIEDDSTFGDNANVLGQALAVRALVAAESERAGDATDFLLEQQCADGYFRLHFTKDERAEDQSCDGGAAKQSAPDVDATALAVLSLQDLADQPEVEDALERATGWLVEQQSAEGAFGGSGADTVDNSNSTGLAGWALGLRGEDEAAEAAATWVRDLQAGVTGACDAWKPDEVGAIAYDEAAYADAGKKGITRSAAGQWLRATVQALPVLEWAPAGATSCEVAG